MTTDASGCAAEPAVIAVRDRYRGCLLGASLGAGAIDADLLDALEGRDTIIQVADDLYDVFADGQEPSAKRYPADGSA